MFNVTEIGQNWSKWNNPSRKITAGHKLIPTRRQVALDYKLCIKCQTLLGLHGFLWATHKLSAFENSQSESFFENLRVFLRKSRVILRKWSFFEEVESFFWRSGEFFWEYGEFFKNMESSFAKVESYFRINWEFMIPESL